MAGSSLEIGSVRPSGDRRKVWPDLLSIVHPLTMRCVSRLIRSSVLFHCNLPKSIPCLQAEKRFSKHDPFAGVTQSKFKAV